MYSGNKENYLNTIKNINENLNVLKNEFTIFKKVSDLLLLKLFYSIMKKYFILLKEYLNKIIIYL